MMKMIEKMVNKIKIKKDDKDKEICKFYSKGHCAKGKKCIFRHIRPEKTVVCKHWLRGLCKKK
jgi:hypothetical protein